MSTRGGAHGDCNAPTRDGVGECQRPDHALGDRSLAPVHLHPHGAHERYPQAKCICVVQDNLNTHTAGALYEAFPPKHVRRILARLEFHPTPKHGSWLNQAEIEISVFERGCLSRPVPDRATLERRVGALEQERNARQATIDWQFTPRQARVKLKKRYPVVKNRPD